MAPKYIAKSKLKKMWPIEHHKIQSRFLKRYIAKCLNSLIETALSYNSNFVKLKSEFEARAVSCQ